MSRTTLALLALISFILAACGSLEEPTPAVTERPTRRPLPPTPTQIAQPTFDLAAFLNVPADDPRSMGSPSAPVTIIEYGDFE
ncbi:MAG: hypothetical protein KatS3mg057_0573 [Herpetosiphonaceae bacterium]|nr:MAG: hypothetical protein KatS3mg057_0573 [Herpetosiphonaceae bacterium]